MAERSLFELFVLTVLFVGGSAIQCNEEPYDSANCTICTKWEDVSSGDIFCDDWPEDMENMNNSGGCEVTGVMEKVCVEEKVYEAEHRACGRVYRSQPEDTCEIVARKAAIDVRHLEDLNERNICDLLPSSESIDICVSGYYDCPEVVVPKERGIGAEFLTDDLISEDQIGSKAVVIVENRRDEKGITLRCWSSDNGNKYIMDQVQIEYRKKEYMVSPPAVSLLVNYGNPVKDSIFDANISHQLAINVNMNTKVSCVLGDSHGKVAVDVYGGDNGPVGRFSHNFLVKPSEVAYYKEGHEESAAMFAFWDRLEQMES